MSLMKILDKKIFLVASPSEGNQQYFGKILEKHYPNSSIFYSQDGVDVLFKTSNFPPQVIICDYNLPKKSGVEVAEEILSKEKFKDIYIIIVSPVQDKEHLVDEVVTGKVQFLNDPNNEFLLIQSINRALNKLSQGEQAEYQLKFLAPGDVLFSEGEKGNCVYFVKRGTLKACKTSGHDRILLGDINSGEFVGEMAHINGEPRSATVEATTDCELIEIPFGTLDTVLFSKPAWSKALLQTLSKRLKKTNETLLDEEHD